MKRTNRKRKTGSRAARELEEINRALVVLYDEFTETTAWTALVFDGVCGILGERPRDVDPDTHTGLRFAAIWLKQRNQNHASTLQTACKKLRAVRGR